MLRNFGPLMAAGRGRDSVLEGWDWVGPADGPTLGHLGTQVGLQRPYYMYKLCGGHGGQVRRGKGGLSSIKLFCMKITKIQQKFIVEKKYST